MRLPDSRPFRRLLASTVISQFGDWSSRIALAVLMFQKTDDPRLVGAIAVAFVLPWLGIGQILTAWTDRFNRQETMVTADLIRASLFAAIAIVDLAALPLLAVVFLAACVDPVFEANASALSYGSLNHEDRDDGIQFKQIANQLAQIAAVGIAGVAVSLASPQTVIFVNAISFALSASIVASTRTSAIAQGANEEAGSVTYALRVIFTNPHFRAAVLVTMLTLFAATVIEAQIAVLASEPMPGWTLPVAAACIPAATAISAVLAPKKGGTRRVLHKSLLATSAAAILGLAALQTSTGIGIVVAAACAGAMFQTTLAGQIVAFRHLPSKAKAATINMAQSLIFIASGAAGAASGIAISWFGRERGIQICMLVAFAAWLVPAPVGDGIGDSMNPGLDLRKPDPATTTPAPV